MNKTLRNHLIEHYRAYIRKRYDYAQLVRDKKFPKSFTHETVTELRNFFLDNLYPSPEKREELDAAFQQLESYVSNPAKIWGLLGNLTAAIFKFGIRFPAAIRVGLAALKTHTSARHFEARLMQAAEEFGYAVPLTDEQFENCLAELPPEQIKDLITDLADLFLSLTDTEMLQKTIEILQGVLEQMKQNKDLYGPEDHDAIQLGIAVLVQGRQLLSKYNDEQKKQIVDFVIYNETNFLNYLQAKRKENLKMREKRS
ncbi:MAG: hypothetical protein NZM35_12025 [Chitinophagales bacterium]|nr:hypothetical protein [Chitinophagales bacterium]MDW8420091.1 hypothetical protein [Chitinophagales bacterium]